MERLNVPRYYLEWVNGRICMMREFVILPFLTIVVKGVAKNDGTFKTHKCGCQANCVLFRSH